MSGLQLIFQPNGTADRIRVSGAIARGLVVGMTAFLTLVDLFAAQAILPSLARHYKVSAGSMGLAVNACTLGMAIASLGVAKLSMRIDRRAGIVASLALLAVPTALLAYAPTLTTFGLLRVAQGVCMATAFTLTLAYLGERFGATEAAAASAAYITGNVASNLVGRMVSAALADHLGLVWNFYAFAALNLAGAALAWSTIMRAPLTVDSASPASRTSSALSFRSIDGALCAACGIGFCILFAFIGTFTYVNFVLMGPPLSLGQMQLGIVYLVFLPSVLTTPFAGAVAHRVGTRTALWCALALACAGLPLLLAPWLAAVLAGLVLVGIGTFLAQAMATGYASRTMALDRGTASGLYLGSYFLGGLAGAAVLGQLFDYFGWPACVAGVGSALAIASLLVRRLDRQ